MNKKPIKHLIDPILTARIIQAVNKEAEGMFDYPRPLLNWTPPSKKLKWSAGVYVFAKSLLNP